MTRNVRCSACDTPIDPANIDSQREIATCGDCGRIVDLRRATGSPAAEPPKATRTRDRAPAELPAGLEVVAGSNLVIRRRWLRQKHWFLLCLFLPAAVYVAYLWSTVGANGWLVVGTLFVVSWNYNLAAAFVNRTVVTADADGITVRHGPLPSLFARNAEVKKADIKQLYSAKHGPAYVVVANRRAAGAVRLVAPLITAEQSLFVERELERALGLVDVPVAGELGSEGEAFTMAGKKPAGAAAGVGMVGLAPVLIAIPLGLFFLMTNTEVSGKLQARGVLGSWQFEPDECRSGQREGFGGVLLTASKDGGKIVRLVRDPIRGNLVVVAVPGRPNHVVSGEACSRFTVNLERTNTNINDIWAMDGNVSLECGELSGSVVFAGCH